jgi:Asp-tRNA(Asn)/Glu-tRNA(Gln) amidotransferase A subunit family amidase
MSDLAMLTATEALRRMRRGELRPEALLEACLARIAEREPTLLVFAHHDAALVRATMPKSGRLAGLPIGVKDVLDTADQPSQYGSPIWEGYRPKADAACVAWARAEGAVVMGKTVTTEFATRKPGPTANPHNAAHTPGGSSSGSAAGVAAGFFPLAFGTQTAGSVIRPAAYCGVVGYKPSFGMIPRLGMKLMSESLDTIGVMARSVADCALFAGAVGGGDLGDPEQTPTRAPRIGICPGPDGVVASAETLALLERAASRLAAAGAIVTQHPLAAEYAALATVQPLVMNGESYQAMGWELNTHLDRISDGLRERLAWGGAQGAAALDAAQTAMTALQARFTDWMADHDILLTPSAPGEAPHGLGATGEPSFNAPWTALHVPCVTIPAGHGPAGLPLGLQIVGKRGADRATLAWAQYVALHGVG